MGNHRFSAEQLEFIKDHVKGRSTQDLTELFNARFGLSLTRNQIRASKKNRKLSSGVDCRFPKGHEPFNKGKKGLVSGGEATQFKKGQMPHNYKPIGTERVNSDGYTDIKIQDGKAQKNWKGKHLVVWEEHHGPVLKGHAVIFGDGNRRNFEPSNLILVSRQQLAVLNKKNLIQNSAELTKTGIIIADIFRKISDRKADTRRRKGV